MSILRWVRFSVTLTSYDTQPRPTARFPYKNTKPIFSTTSTATHTRVGDNGLTMLANSLLVPTRPCSQAFHLSRPGLTVPSSEVNLQQGTGLRFSVWLLTLGASTWHGYCSFKPRVDVVLVLSAAGGFSSGASLRRSCRREFSRTVIAAVFRPASSGRVAAVAAARGGTNPIAMAPQPLLLVDGAAR
ncbi:unnamed protein product [Ectocarpus sp. 4 AP-2014]